MDPMCLMHTLLALSPPLASFRIPGCGVKNTIVSTLAHLLSANDPPSIAFRLHVLPPSLVSIFAFQPSYCIRRTPTTRPVTSSALCSSHPRTPGALLRITKRLPLPSYPVVLPNHDHALLRAGTPAAQFYSVTSPPPHESPVPCICPLSLAHSNLSPHVANHSDRAYTRAPSHHGSLLGLCQPLTSPHALECRLAFLFPPALPSPCSLVIARSHVCSPD
ncbi:hypothetical protein C8Q74DRAFT_270940 [Fomes fomentarius]|nr:hypothetical protein C8Q74DRAFT_270940 [Fomes fomentarius]